MVGVKWRIKLDVLEIGNTRWQRVDANDGTLPILMNLFDLKGFGIVGI